jgi:hypothetical protein
MKRPLILILFLFSLFRLPVRGQEISVTAAFDTSRILIGDQISFIVVVEQPADLKMSLPVFKDTLTRNIEILSGPAIDSAKLSGEKLRITEKYLITSFDSGFYRIDPVYAETRDASGLKRYYSDYSLLEVARVKLTPPDTVAKIFDIVKPYKAPVTLGEIMPWLLLVLVISAVIWLIIRFLKRFSRSKKEVLAPVNIEPSHIIAFRELERLRDEKLWQNGETKKYYTRLTEILRQYLENRFEVFSLELTTSETLEALVKTGFKKDESYNKLKSVLNGADLVKFAKYKPESSENELSFENSWEFVTATRKSEEPAQSVDVKEKIREDSV